MALTLVSGGFFVMVPSAEAAARHPMAADANTVSLWHLDDPVTASGTVVDAKGNHNGTGGTSATYTTGQTGFGYAQYFARGSSSSVKAQRFQASQSSTCDLSITNCSLAAKPWSFEAWVSIPDNVTWGNLGVLSYSDGSGGLNWALGTGGTTGTVGHARELYMMDSVGSGAKFSGYAFPQDGGLWHYVAVTHYGTNSIAFYVDGVQTSASPAGANSAYAANYAVFMSGSYAATGGNFYGGNAPMAIDEIRISDKVRTAQEISDYYNTTLVTDVTSGTTNGSYSVGTTIPITVTFSKAVTVTGAPRLQLNATPTTRYAAYAGGSGGATLTFNYVIQEGDTVDDLDYASSSALTLNGGTINDAYTYAAALDLAAPGTSGSLGFNRNFVIGVLEAAPVVTSTSDSPASKYPNTVVHVSGTATDEGASDKVTRIEIYVDGTAPGDLKAACDYTPAQASATCDGSVGAYASGAHSYTVRAYDSAGLTGNGTGAFTVLANPVSSFGDTIQIANAGNAAPTVDAVIPSDASGSGSVALPAQGFTLNEGTTRPLYVRLTVFDQNGCTDLAAVRLTVYRSGAAGGSACTPDQNDCYAVDIAGGQLLGCAGAGDSDATFEAVLPVANFADPTDAGSPHEAETWKAQAVVTDSADLSGSLTTDFEVQSLAALSVAPEVMDYGTVALGAVSSQQTLTFTNVGNRAINSYVRADGPMHSSLVGFSDIPSGQAHFSVSQAATWASGTPIAVSDANLPIALDQQVDDGGAAPTAQAYFYMKLPASGIRGTYTNNLYFTAYAQ